MIEIKNVTKRFGEKTAVNNLSVDIPTGCIVGFIGPNGAGKTTTIHMMTGVLTPDEGTITLNGKDIVKDPVNAKREFGLVPDSPDLFLRLSGMEYIQFMADIYHIDTETRNERIQKYAKDFGMEDALSDRMSSYSHGMRQKMMVMGALIHDPSIWILDEPLTGLDPKASFELKEMMREHAQSGHAVLFSTHVLEVAEKLCDQVVIINRGRIVFQGTLDQLREGYPEGTGLEEIFLTVTEHA